MEQINGHMYFRNVWGSIAPVDPPTVEQTADCLGYAFRKWRVQKRCFIYPSGGMRSWSAIIIQNFETADGPVPKSSRKWHSSVLADLIALPALFWMSFPPRKKSLAIGLVILFCLYHPLPCEGVDGRSTSEWREEGARIVMMINGERSCMQGRVSLLLLLLRTCVHMNIVSYAL